MGPYLLFANSNNKQLLIPWNVGAVGPLLPCQFSTVLAFHSAVVAQHGFVCASGAIWAVDDPVVSHRQQSRPSWLPSFGQACDPLMSSGARRHFSKKPECPGSVATATVLLGVAVLVMCSCCQRC